MRRWNGWGLETTDYPLPDSAEAFLRERIGPGITTPDAPIEDVLSQVPPSRLDNFPNIITAPFDRLVHARGQSLPDWIALRSGRIGAFPDAVTFPETDQQVAGILKTAARAGLQVIPYGGGTSVVGHINPEPSENPVLTVDMARINRLIDLDETSRLATFGAGVTGPGLENQLNARGYTLGHFPQSFELSTLGGWIATRSSGQQSFYYGRIEDLFAGGHLETPCGPLELPPLPASAAGPDIRQLVLGSEGRLGVITQAAVRVRALPEFESFFGVFFHDWESGAETVRRMAQEGAPISMARLSNSYETETTLALSGKDTLVRWARRGLGLAGYGSQPCLLVFGLTGSARQFARTRSHVLSLIRAGRGLFTGQAIGRMWRKSRFLSPYLRNTLWERGYAIDTLETALPWRAVLPASQALHTALSGALAPFNERCIVLTHLSHIYADGASIYITCIFRRVTDPDETLARWKALKTSASETILAHHGTISHQHGVGQDHAPYLPAEKGELGMAMIRQMAKTLDPSEMMNPGKLFAAS